MYANELKAERAMNRHGSWLQFFGFHCECRSRQDSIETNKDEANGAQPKIKIIQNILISTRARPTENHSIFEKNRKMPYETNQLLSIASSYTQFSCLCMCGDIFKLNSFERVTLGQKHSSHYVWRNER